MKAEQSLILSHRAFKKITCSSKSRYVKSDLDPVSLYKGISKLIIVDIALEQQDNPQLIFESLNSTGMDLSQADLIRNYVLDGTG